MIVRNLVLRPTTVALLAAVVGVPVIGGCNRSSAPDKLDSGPVPRVVRASPSKLFAGDLARLEPHVGLVAAGCLLLDAPDEDLFIGVEPEVWRDGKPDRPVGSARMRVKGPSEVSFSLREVTDTRGQRKYRLVASVSDRLGRSTWTTEVDVPERTAGVTSSNPAEMSGSRELAEGATVAVWGYVIHRDGEPVRVEPVEAAGRSTRWAIITKIRWERAEGR